MVTVLDTAEENKLRKKIDALGRAEAFASSPASPPSTMSYGTTIASCSAPASIRRCRWCRISSGAASR